MQTALKYPTAFKSHNFCGVGVGVPVLESMRLGLREVKVSPEVTQLQLRSARSSPKHWVLTTTGPQPRSVAGSLSSGKRAESGHLLADPRAGGAEPGTSPWLLKYSCWVSTSIQGLGFTIRDRGGFPANSRDLTVARDALPESFLCDGRHAEPTHGLTHSVLPPY